MKYGLLQCAILFERWCRVQDGERRIAAVVSIIQDASAPSEISPPALQRVGETRERQGQAKLLQVLQYLPECFQPDVS